MNAIINNQPGESVTLVEVLELIRPYEEFESVIQVAMRRLETEGVASLIRMQFYAHPGSTEVGAVITFSNREQFMEHIHMISSWPEFKRFFSTVKPIDVRIYGQLSPEAEAWVRNFDLAIKKFEHFVAGFVRKSTRYPTAT